VVQLRPPPLRDRGDDTLILADYFLRQFTLAMNKRVTGFSPGARKKLLSHAWPGNVRELRNVIERAVILSVEEVISIEDLPDFEVENRLRSESETNPRFGATSVTQNNIDSGILPGEEQDLNQQLANFETEAIMTALRKHNFNMTSTSESLGITRHALRYRMRRLQLDLDSESGE
jgi:DNA-binding NtrC family response regulator